MKHLRKTTNVLLSLIILIVAWQLIVLIGNFEESLLPSPLSVGKGIIALLVDGTLLTHIQVSLFRFVIGYTLAVIAAIPLGFIFGRMEWLWALIDPIVQVLRPVSPLAWSPFIVLWFGIGNAPTIVVIFLAAFYPVLLSTVSAVRKVDRLYLRVAENFEITGLPLLTKVIFPAAFPFIANGLHMAIGMAWIFLVSGEMMGVQSGLGYLIMDSRNLIRLDLVAVGIIFIGLCGLLLDRLIGWLERWVEKHWGIMPKG